VSDIRRGVSDINKEILSELNPQFVLHDSLGFEGGDDSNLQIVLNFIKTRSRRANLKDQLHAIWCAFSLDDYSDKIILIMRRLCIQTPAEKGRVFETGTETLLEAKQRGDLGDGLEFVICYR
jgi:hypothetical protein